MVSENSTKLKNEIYRKIKLYKAKRTNLQDFTRKKKDEILTERLERQKQESILFANDLSMTTLGSTPAPTRNLDMSPKKSKDHLTSRTN